MNTTVSIIIIYEKTALIIVTPRGRDVYYITTGGTTAGRQLYFHSTFTLYVYASLDL